MSTPTHTFIPFPKITGKLNEFLVNLERLKRAGKIRNKHIKIEGTVKLHGMHADIVYDPSSDEAGINFQSRNRICERNECQQGWPRNVSHHTQALSSLKTKIISRFVSKNPTARLSSAKSLIVAGEWIGRKVQPGVGVSQLSGRFVILSIQINGIWQHDSDFAGIEEPSAAIYNIMRVPPFIVTYDITNRSPTNHALHEMQRLADQVEAACPYAAHFGITESRGEGIVWKPMLAVAHGEAKYWFKMKGPLSDPVNRVDISSISSISSTPAGETLSVDEAANSWVTPRRIEQALEYVAEMNHETRGQRERAFTKWMTSDILTEERAEIDGLAANDMTFIKRLRERIYFNARDAFLEREGKGKSVMRAFKAISSEPKRYRAQSPNTSAISNAARSFQTLSLNKGAEKKPTSADGNTEVYFTPETVSTLQGDDGGKPGKAPVLLESEVTTEAAEYTKNEPRELTNEERFLQAMEQMLKR